MLSKSRGHVLRLAAVIHMLGYIETPDDIPEEISESALKVTVWCLLMNIYKFHVFYYCFI